MNRYPILCFFALILFSCQQSTDKLVPLFKLPKQVKECSGIITDVDRDLIWAIADSGNENTVFGLNEDGNVAKTLTLNNARNIDWEDITSDQAGNLYIGDFGNNDNKRKDLSIYKINPDAQATELQTLFRISFYYPEQTEFPPNKKSLFYDCEAFFELNGSFYLFTKNRSKGFDGTTLIYKVPNTEGNHAAQLLGRYKTGDDYNNSAITGAAISPDRSKFVLLSHSRIWLFEGFKGDDFLNGKITQLELNHYSQKEAVCFKDNQTLLIADEKDKKTGGNLYEVSLATLKAKP
ncbi:hypothetical protein [Flavobacterium sp.]